MRSQWKRRARRNVPELRGWAVFYASIVWTIASVLECSARRNEEAFVGPKSAPPLRRDAQDEIPYYEERHSVRPGMTGWAQVQYPYGATVQEAARKLEYDRFI